MTSNPYVGTLEAIKAERLATIFRAGQAAIAVEAPQVEPAKLLHIALANEIGASELAAAWMPSTQEVEVKIALGRQAGDEAMHFQLVADRLAALGFDLSGFSMPASNPLFDYLRGLPSTVERIAGGLFTLESIAYGVNENFMAFCEKRGDLETVRIYRGFIQPDERAHQRLGQQLLAKYATSPEAQAKARDVVVKTLEIAAAARARTTEKMGTACYPGC